MDAMPHLPGIVFYSSWDLHLEFLQHPGQILANFVKRLFCDAMLNVTSKGPELEPKVLPVGKGGIMYSLLSSLAELVSTSWKAILDALPLCCGPASGYVCRK